MLPFMKNAKCVKVEVFVCVVIMEKTLLEDNDPNENKDKDLTEITNISQVQETNKVNHQY